MIPILYKSTETEFKSLGLGLLTDCIEPTVEETRNGIFEFRMQYPINSVMAKEIKEDRIIKASAGFKFNNPATYQLFIIKKVTHRMNSAKLTIHAEHVSYLAFNYPLRPEVKIKDSDGLSALKQWKDSIIVNNPFRVWSDINTISSTTWTIDNVENARYALAGRAGSILQMWNGEFEFDNFNINLWERRGVDSQAYIAYSRNLLNLEQEKSILKTVTSIYPYAVYEDVQSKEKTIITIPEMYVDSEHVDKYARRNILPVNFSPEGATTDDKKITPEQLRKKAKRYIETNKVGVPKINIKIDFIDLRKQLNGKDLDLLEQINLCDRIPVFYQELGINSIAKVTRIVWDVWNEKYITIELGDMRTSISRVVDGTIDSKLDQFVDKSKHIAYAAAGGKNTIFKGDEEPKANKEGDLWYKPLHDTNHNTEMYIWNGSRWERVTGTNDLEDAGRLITGTLDAAVVNVINLNAMNITTGTLRGGKVNWNLDTGYLNINDDIIYNPNTRTTKIYNTTELDNAIIDAAQIKNAAITSAKIQDGVITNAKIDRLDARYITLDGVSLNNFIGQKMSTGGFEFDSYGNFELKGNSIHVSDDSNYVTITDRGSRGQVDINGTVAARGSGYVVEMNSGGLLISTNGNSAKLQTSSRGVLYTPDGFNVGGTGLYVNGIKIDDLIREIVAGML